MKTHLYTRLLAHKDLVFLRTQKTYTKQYAFAFNAHSYVDTLHAYLTFVFKTNIYVKV